VAQAATSLERSNLEAAERLAQQLFRLVRLIERTKAQAAATNPGEHLERAVFGLLVQLADKGPQRTTALAEAVYSDTSTVSRQVGQLVRLGLVERRADPDDGRACLLAATEKGVERLATARRQRNERIAALIADWPHADREQLTALLDRFNSSFESQRSHWLPEQRSGQEPA
jgi:DNA-binding MarR family transcriptional regulator